MMADDEETPQALPEAPPETPSNDIAKDDDTEDVEDAKASSSSSSSLPAPGRCLLMTIVGLCCGIALIVIIVTFVFIGVGDEKHESGSIENENCVAGSFDSNSTSVSILSFNTYLIYCLGDAIFCEDEDTRRARLPKISAWMKERTEDVVILQEVWSLHDELKDAIANAGFCHYVMTKEKYGSGLAIFSKYPIVESDFVDWYDAFGIGSEHAPDLTNVEVYIADKGVLYANIQVSEDTNIHIMNLHTSSDTKGDAHEERMEQYQVTKTFLDEKKIPSDEVVLLGGDFNEDLFCTALSCVDDPSHEPYCQNQTYYNEMLEVLSAEEPTLVGDQLYTYDTELNLILQDKYAEEKCTDHQFRLDYWLYSTDHLIPGETSTCEILTARSPDGAELSDHFPLTCTIDI